MLGPRCLTNHSWQLQQAQQHVKVAPCTQARPLTIVTRAANNVAEKKKETKVVDPSGGLGLGDLGGPIGLTVGPNISLEKKASASAQAQGKLKTTPQGGIISGSGIELGPIGLTIGSDIQVSRGSEGEEQGQRKSIHSMTTAEWRAKYEKDGMVDLWVEEEFNAGSRLIGGRDVHKGGVAGFGTGEGPSAGNAPVYKVKIFNHYANQEIDVEVPEDRYILFDAEDKGLQLPYACRMGCCTACAVRIKEGEMYQPQALGISEELKQQGYGLLCVGFPSSDLVVETVPEDEVYELQFGEVFAQRALDPDNPDAVERDDFALSIANMDE